MIVMMRWIYAFILLNVFAFPSHSNCLPGLAGCELSPRTSATSAALQWEERELWFGWSSNDPDLRVRYPSNIFVYEERDGHEGRLYAWSARNHMNTAGVKVTWNDSPAPTKEQFLRGLETPPRPLRAPPPPSASRGVIKSEPRSEPRQSITRSCSGKGTMCYVIITNSDDGKTGRRYIRYQVTEGGDNDGPMVNPGIMFETHFPLEEIDFYAPIFDRIIEGMRWKKLLRQAGGPPNASTPGSRKVFIVFFDWNTDAVSPEGSNIVAQAVAAIRAGNPGRVQVSGYTDRSLTPAESLELSTRMSRKVASLLEDKGISRSKLIVSGYGEDHLRVPQLPGEREPQNRRVEIVMD
jgi:hypothetical protein